VVKQKMKKERRKK